MKQPTLREIIYEIDTGISLSRAEAEQAIQTLIDQEVKKARINESSRA